MRRVRVAYRDNDRTPVIFCIREMAERYYDVSVEPVQLSGPTGNHDWSNSEEFDSAIFVHRADVIIERLERLYLETARGRKVTMFCAPIVENSYALVVPPSVRSLDDMRGKKIAVRSLGFPHQQILRLRMLGLERQVTPVLIDDSEVGRWAQWKKVVSGECIGFFMSYLYLPDALDAGLTVLPTPPLPMIGHFSQACTASFAKEHRDLLRDYIKAVVHALCLMKLQPEQAMEIVSGEPRRLLKIDDPTELKRWFDGMTANVQIKPFPTAQAILNTYEIVVNTWPEASGLNALLPWDCHLLKELDDEGFIHQLVQQMS